MLQVGYTAAWDGRVCVAVMVWQLSQGPIPPTAVVNVGRATACCAAIPNTATMASASKSTTSERLRRDL